MVFVEAICERDTQYDTVHLAGTNNGKELMGFQELYLANNEERLTAGSCRFPNKAG